MTAKEMADYEVGKAYGYRNPNKVILWPKSDAWCQGVKAGIAEYWKDRKKQPISAAERYRQWKYRQDYLERKRRRKDKWEGTNWYE